MLHAVLAAYSHRGFARAPARPLRAPMHAAPGTRPQLDEIRAARGGAEPSAEPLKPLSEVLREAKEAKQAAFDNQWKTMKTGGLHL